MTPLATLLAERIRRFGPITFAEYMRECLYHPLHGYYSQPEARRFTDYYTSVDVHPIFGRLLARQFAEMWEQLGRPSEFQLVEAAAGTGRLAGTFWILPRRSCRTSTKRSTMWQSKDRRHVAPSWRHDSVRTSPRVAAKPPSRCPRKFLLAAFFRMSCWTRSRFTASFNKTASFRKSL